MLSFNRAKKAIELTKYVCYAENHGIKWRQLVSEKGKVQGIGSFLQQKSKRYGGWSKTLQKRILARHEKGKDWGKHIQKEQEKEDSWSKTLQNRINARHEKGENWKDY